MPISPRWSYVAPDRREMISDALDMPFSPWRSFSYGIDAGAQFTGIGSIARDFATPRGGLSGQTNPVEDGLAANPMTSGIVRGYEALRNLVGAKDSNEPLSEDAYKASPFFRDAIKWDPGMTADRAAALAGQFDMTQAKNFYASKNPVQFFLGQFVGGAIDPVNFVPVFGPGARAAAVAKFGMLGRFGEIAGESAVNMAEAAISTAALDLMTAQDRARYGDDVSWQAQVNDIWMSALIGGAIAPVIHGAAGAFDLGRTAAGSIRDAYQSRKARTVQSSMETVQNVATARAIGNDVVTSVATTGEARMSPGSEAGVRQLADVAATRRDASVALERETAGVTADKGIVITPSGARVEVRPEVVDLAELIKATGDLQVRDRSRSASAAQIEDIAVNLDPARLMPSIEADRGAPIVGPDNVVDSGNGRVAAIKRAYEAYPEKAAAYRKAIEDRGFAVDGMQMPVLIQRRVTDLSPQARAQFNTEANQSATARMSPSEMAQIDANALPDHVLAQKADGPVTNAENRTFVDAFLARIPQNERAALHQADGTLSAEGQRRIENALVAAAYGSDDPSVVRRFTEATDDNTRSVVGALSDVAGKWALMRRAAKAGEIDPALDMTPELTGGLRKLSQWREQAAREGRPVPMVIKEGMAQLDMLDGEMTLEAKTLVRLFYKTDDFNRSAGREVIAGRLEQIINDIEANGRPQLFGDAEAATKLGVLQHAVNDQPADLFAPADIGARTDGVGGEGIGNAASADRGDAAQGSLIGEGGGRNPDDIEGIMSDRFAAAGRPDDEAKAAGVLVDKFYRQMAERLGTTPADIVRRFGLPEVRQGAGAATLPEGMLAQGAIATDTPEFKAWFGDSKVVDDSGAPLVVYHGTPDTRAILKNGFRAGAGRGDAIFFSSDKRVAETYADDSRAWDYQNAEPFNLGVYLSLKNPKVIDAKGAHWRDTEAQVEAAKDEGHDGIIIRNTIDEYQSMEGKGGRASDVYVAFEPTQIKSAMIGRGRSRVDGGDLGSIENRGTFDPNDPRILFQPAYHGTPHIFDKFDSSKIGTGEGAQAFGHGLYFAGRKEVAAYYREALSKPSILFDGKREIPLSLDMGKNSEGSTAIWFLETAKSVPEAIKTLRETAAQEPVQRMKGYYTEAADWLEANSGRISVEGHGRLLTVDIPHDDELMAWDLPLSEQPPKVKEAILKIPGVKEMLAKLATEDDQLLRDLGQSVPEGGAGQWPAMSGAEFYNRLGDLYVQQARAAGKMDTRGNAREIEASNMLREAGIPGHRFLDQQSRNPRALADAKGSLSVWEKALEKSPDDAYIKGEVEARRAEVAKLEAELSHNYVIYDDSRVQVTGFEQRARAAISFGDDGRSIITLFEGADPSSALHELGHHFLHMFKSMADADGAPLALKQDMATLKDWWAANADAVATDSPMEGVTGADVVAVLRDGTTGDRVKDLAINVGLQEHWARGFEAYLREGEAPTPGLRGLFEQFKRWLSSVYRSAVDLKVNVSPEIKGVFDRMLGGEERAAEPVDTRDPMAGFRNPAPEPLPPELAAASARVGVPENIKALQEQYGLNPDGSFDEAPQIDHLREMGMLDEVDEKTLKAADEAIKDADAYEKTLAMVANCVAGVF